MAGIVQLVPDGHRLGGEAAVRKRDHQRRARPEHAGRLAQHRHRLGEIIDRDAQTGRVKFGVAIGQARVAVEVVHHPFGQPRVGGQLLGIHAQPGHAPIGYLRRQMADPAAHQIQHRSARRKILAVKLGHRRDGAAVNMRHQPRRLIEDLIRRLILAPKRAGRQSAHREFPRLLIGKSFMLTPPEIHRLMSMLLISL